MKGLKREEKEREIVEAQSYPKLVPWSCTDLKELSWLGLDENILRA